MSPWMFNLCMDEVIKEIMVRVAGVGVRMVVNGRE